MYIHEYQAKELFREYGIPVATGHLALSPKDAVLAAEKLIGEKVVVKAQVHAGGRGKAGGVKLCSKQDVHRVAEDMIGMKIITPQTGKEGKTVRRLYIEECRNIGSEFYLSAVMDREKQGITFIASREGGVNIEEVAEKSPEKVIKVTFDPNQKLDEASLGKIATCLQINESDKPQMIDILKGIYRLFLEKDCSQIEINPLVTINGGGVMALDAKINFDSNALFRHPELATLRDIDEEDPLEYRASKSDLNYIRMPGGNIGCMVNGAGLAMATMDIIKLHGGEPANFLDVGGGATAQQVEEAFQLILSDGDVKAILINIFGGIMRCDIIAEGVVQAARNIGITIPVVVRLEGTNAEEGKKILKASGFDLIPATDLEDAAEKVVKAVV